MLYAVMALQFQLNLELGRLRLNDVWFAVPVRFLVDTSVQLPVWLWYRDMFESPPSCEALQVNVTEEEPDVVFAAGETRVTVALRCRIDESAAVCRLYDRPDIRAEGGRTPRLPSPTYVSAWRLSSPPVPTDRVWSRRAGDGAGIPSAGSSRRWPPGYQRDRSHGPGTSC